MSPPYAFLYLNDRLTKALEGVTRDVHPDDDVFSKADGSAFREIRTGFERAVKKTGLGGLTFHDLRRTFAGRLMMAGADIIAVQELWEPKGLRMTRRYSHPTPEHNRSAVK